VKLDEVGDADVVEKLVETSCEIAYVVISTPSESCDLIDEPELNFI
jgi:hypothetical protein